MFVCLIVDVMAQKIYEIFIKFGDEVKKEEFTKLWKVRLMARVSATAAPPSLTT